MFSLDTTFIFKFDPSAHLEDKIDGLNRITQDLINCGENISNDL